MYLLIQYFEDEELNCKFYLHSIMYLLIPDILAKEQKAGTDLHSIMYLLILTQKIT